MQLDTKEAYLLLGSNMGDRSSNLETAIAEIAERVGVVKHKSSIYETEPWGNTEQPGFLNQAIMIKTTYSPRNLLMHLLAIEEEMGRVRLQKWGQRLIDLDIIFYEDEIVDEEDLKIPHPYMQQRKFVLVPLVEIAPDHIHPVLKQKISSILLNLHDELTVTKI